MSDIIVGLTGGIGSGKSTVAEAFVALGAGLVDTDQIAHELTATEGAAMPALRAAFGEEILTENGALNRSQMRQIIFTDPAAKIRLEGILHPLIQQISAERCRRAEAPYVILAVPLLLELGNYRSRCQRIVVVDCPEKLQIERVMARNGLPREEVERIMQSQASRATRLSIADDVITNSGERSDLSIQVEKLHQRYLELAR